MAHHQFDVSSATDWINSKIEVDATPGCRVRAILREKDLAGWCGIQHEMGQYELALVLDEKYWGLGKSVFVDLMAWANELGHEAVFIHFLHTRPAYKFLQKRAIQVFTSEMYNTQFTTYQLRVR